MTKPKNYILSKNIFMQKTFLTGHLKHSRKIDFQISPAAQTKVGPSGDNVFDRHKPTILYSCHRQQFKLEQIYFSLRLLSFLVYLQSFSQHDLYPSRYFLDLHLPGFSQHHSLSKNRLFQQFYLICIPKGFGIQFWHPRRYTPFSLPAPPPTQYPKSLCNTCWTQNNQQIQQ